MPARLIFLHLTVNLRNLTGKGPGFKPRLSRPIINMMTSWQRSQEVEAQAGGPGFLTGGGFCFIPRY